MFLKWLEVLGEKMLLLLVWTVCYLAATSKPEHCMAMKKEGRKEIEPCWTRWTSQLVTRSLGSEKRKHSLSSHWEKVRSARAGQSETSHWDDWAILHVFPAGFCSTGIKARVVGVFCLFVSCTKSGCCTTSHTPHLSLTILVTIIYVLTNGKQIFFEHLRDIVCVGPEPRR